MHARVEDPGDAKRPRFGNRPHRAHPAQWRDELVLKRRFCGDGWSDENGSSKEVQECDSPLAPTRIVSAVPRSRGKVPLTGYRTGGDGYQPDVGEGHRVRRGNHRVQVLARRLHMP